ncbi:Peptidase M50 [Gammaproteobacteria bacterium]
MDMQSFFSLLIAATLLAKVPVISQPLVWFETFFHELSHILVGLVTHGKVTELVLNWNGTGYCMINNGADIPIFLAGYLGAPLWGAWMYSIGKGTMPSQVALRRTRMLRILLIVSAALWVRDSKTFLIMSFLFGVTWVMALGINHYRIQQFTRFCGIYVMLNALHATVTFENGKIIAIPYDSINLARVTGLDTSLFVGIWYVFALLLLLTVAFSSWALNDVRREVLPMPIKRSGNARNRRIPPRLPRPAPCSVSNSTSNYSHDWSTTRD